MVGSSFDLVLAHLRSVVHYLKVHRLSSSHSSFVWNHEKVEDSIALALNKTNVKNCTRARILNVTMISFPVKKSMTHISINEAIDKFGLVALLKGIYRVFNLWDFIFQTFLLKSRPPNSISIDNNIFRKLAIVSLLILK